MTRARPNSGTGPPRAPSPIDGLATVLRIRDAESGAVAITGAVAVVTAPLSVPSNAIFGAGLAITTGASLLFGAKGELSRALEQAS